MPDGYDSATDYYATGGESESGGESEGEEAVLKLGTVVEEAEKEIDRGRARSRSRRRRSGGTNGGGGEVHREGEAPGAFNHLGVTRRLSSTSNHGTSHGT